MFTGSARESAFISRITLPRCAFTVISLICRYALLCVNFHIGRANSVNCHVERLDGNRTLQSPGVDLHDRHALRPHQRLLPPHRSAVGLGDLADCVADLLYLPEVLYCIGLAVVMLGGAGPWSLDAVIATRLAT